MHILNKQSRNTNLSSLIEQISHLDGTEFDEIFEEQQTRIKLFSEVATFCELAYEYNNPYCATVLQKILYKIYSLHMNIPIPGSKTAESSLALLNE